MMRLLVCGGRTYDDWRFLQRTLAELHEERPIALVIHGGAAGADRLGKRWAETQGIPCCEFPPQWTRYGKKAGPLRNQWMLTFGQPDLVVAFPGGPGTERMIGLSRGAGVETVVVGRKPWGSAPASVDGSPQGRDGEAGSMAEGHDSAVPAKQADAQDLQS